MLRENTTTNNANSWDCEHERKVFHSGTIKSSLQSLLGKEVHYSVISRYSHICNNLETVYTVIWFLLKKDLKIRGAQRLMEFLCCLRFLQTVKAASQKVNMKRRQGSPYAWQTELFIQLAYDLRWGQLTENPCTY